MSCLERGCPECGGAVGFWPSALTWYCRRLDCPWCEQGEWWLGATLWADPEWADLEREVELATDDGPR